MKALIITFTVAFLSIYNIYGQSASPIDLRKKLFESETPLYLNIDYSKAEIKKNREDTVYTTIQMRYSEDQSRWKSIETRVIGRGNFRFKICYFPPLKLKLKKPKAEGTLFEGHKTLKLVLPCLPGEDMNDNVIKEYLAYKFYEVLTPYSFRTQLVRLTLDELKDGETIKHEVRGFLIEDDKVVAERFGAKVIDKPTHPLTHDDKTSVINAFFQFMIANVDFSTAYSHNSKMLEKADQLLPVPYDFDMSGFVNPIYGFVPQSVGGEPLGIKELTDRKYRGFKRDRIILDEVRQLYLKKKSSLLDIMIKNKALFENQSEYKEAENFLLSFYNILESDLKFEALILNEARTN